MKRRREGQRGIRGESRERSKVVICLRERYTLYFWDRRKEMQECAHMYVRKQSRTEQRKEEEMSKRAVLGYGGRAQ